MKTRWKKNDEFVTEIRAVMEKYNVTLRTHPEYDGEEEYRGDSHTFEGEDVYVCLDELEDRLP